MVEYAKHWKKSASIIVTAKDQTNSNSCNFKVLTLERVNQSTTYPGVTVYPGGVVEKADTSQDWLLLYNNFGFTIDSFESLNLKGNRPRIFTTLDSNEIPCYLSLRIAAIRETFEETGILICKEFNKRYEDNSCWANFILLDDLKKWQDKVSGDASEFIKFCQQFQVYPDVWSLHEWSNWLAPSRALTRFDVMFFLVAFREIPLTHMNVHEASQLCWNTPKNHLQQSRENKIILLAPQFYELSRLKIFSDITKLAEFAQTRAHYGTETYVSHVVFTQDAMCSVLPGDELYSELSQEEDIYLETMPESKVQHRIYLSSLHGLRLVVKNLKPLYNHITPLSSKM